MIYESICNIPECNGDDTDSPTYCGEDKGFFKFNGLYSVNSSVRNITHDLLLLYRVKKLLKLPKYSNHFERKFKERNEFLYDIFEKSNYYGNEEALEQEEALEKEKALEEVLEKEKALDQEEVLKEVFKEAFNKALEKQKDIKKHLTKEQALEKPLEKEFLIEEALEEALEEAVLKAPEKNQVLKEAFKKAKAKVLEIKKIEYGSPEKYNVSPLTDGLPEKINNVIDAHNALKKQIMTPNCKSRNDSSHGIYAKYSGTGKPYSSLGTLTIYESGIPMKFVPTLPIV